MGPMNTILLVAWAISAVALIVLVLMHSGKGTGVSDMIASSMYNANAGSGVWEKNLDRLTVIAAVVFIATIDDLHAHLPAGHGLLARLVAAAHIERMGASPAGEARPLFPVCFKLLPLLR